MARLNEPPMAMDGSDILRKKLLRQNRDLAKSNAGLTIRIRILEQEKQQLINQKLELAGRVLDLEQKIERNATQRIADQALEIRARLEAQLSDCMNILSGLGQEPPRKRRQPSSPRSAKGSRLRLSIQHRSPPRRRMIESEKEAEMRALSEGRLVPIFETQHVSRRTMNPEQIQALCSEAADSSNLTDSPELGPPPMSRFVDADAGADTVTIMPLSQQGSPSPIRRSEPPVKDEQPLPSPAASPIKAAKSEDAKPTSPEIIPAIRQPEPPQSPTVAVDTLRTSSKRKFANNDINAQDPSMFVSEVPPTRITAAIRGERKNKTLKELTSLRREARAKQAAPPTEARKPLSAKSTNENLESPKKTSKAQAPASPAKVGKAKGRARKMNGMVKDDVPETVLIHVPMEPPTLPEPAKDVIPTETAPPIQAAPPSPASPTPTPSAPRAHDTPPPADISAMGETARPSRRSRASISYAEPNLRDKMRRPTKELFDAVAGDSRYKSRHSTSRPEEVISATAQESSDVQDGAADSAPTPADPRVSVNHEPCSPLMRKAKLELDASAGEDQTPAKEEISLQIRTVIEPESMPACPSVAKKTHTMTDPYDFSTSSPNSEGASTPSEETKPPRRHSKSSRRLSSMARGDSQSDNTETKQKPKPTAGKKRASSTHTRLDRSQAAESSADMSGSTDGREQQSTRVTGRRRSAMA